MQSFLSRHDSGHPSHTNLCCLCQSGPSSRPFSQLVHSALSVSMLLREALAFKSEKEDRIKDSKEDTEAMACPAFLSF